MSAPVVVTDGEQRAALAIVRSLGTAGYTVHVTSRRGRSLAGVSRHARADHPVPGALTAPDEHATALAALAARLGARAVVPVTEPALLAVLQARERFGEAIVPFPDAGTFRAISDKARVLDVATRLGIAVPRAVTLDDARALDALAAALAFPSVVKPSRSVADGPAGRGKHDVRHARDAAQLRTVVDALPASAFPVLLQQRIVGPGTGIFLLRWDGRTLAAFAHRRLREKPPSGGVSVYSESVPADPALVARSEALLAHFDWRGVAMVEYKMDAATGTPYLMEINGRFWGSLQLAIDAGVDFPRLLLAAATGAAEPPVTRYRVGARNRWWWGDVDQLITRLRRSRARLALPPGAPGRLAAVAEFVGATLTPGRNEVLHLDDPMPFVRETADWLRGR